MTFLCTFVTVQSCGAAASERSTLPPLTRDPLGIFGPIGAGPVRGRGVEPIPAAGEFEGPTCVLFCTAKGIWMGLQWTSNLFQIIPLVSRPALYLWAMERSIVSLMKKLSESTCDR